MNFTNHFNFEFKYEVQVILLTTKTIKLLPMIK